MSVKHASRDRKTARLERRIKELETVQRQSQSAWHLAEVGQMMASVIHELKNPLTIILGFAQQLGRPPDKNPETVQVAAAIEREAQRCGRLVQNILNFSRRTTLVQQREDMRTIIDAALALVVPLARSRGVAVETVIAAELPMLQANRHRLEQLIINLCTNGLDAMMNGGTLNVDVLPQPSATNAQSIVIRVQDTGHGIPEAVRQRMFEPFFTTKAYGEGTGLGMSMVADIVKEHQGHIDVVSRVGLGTTVSVMLPLTLKKGAKDLGPGRLRESSDSGRF